MLVFIQMIEESEIRGKLEELYLEYHKEMFWKAYEIVQDHHEAEDILQTAFLKICNHLDKIDKVKSRKTRAYVILMIRNLAIDRYRYRSKTVPADFTYEDGDETLASTDLLLEDHMIQVELMEGVYQAFRCLHPDHADIIALKYYYEYTNSQIAEIFNISADNVSVRLNRARAALKKLISEGGGK